MTTKIIIDLDEELCERELESFKAQADKLGHGLKEHICELAFGEKVLAGAGIRFSKRRRQLVRRKDAQA